MDFLGNEFEETSSFILPSVFSNTAIVEDECVDCSTYPSNSVSPAFANEYGDDQSSCISDASTTSSDCTFSVIEDGVGFLTSSYSPVSNPSTTSSDYFLPMVDGERVDIESRASPLVSEVSAPVLNATELQTVPSYTAVSNVSNVWNVSNVSNISNVSNVSNPSTFSLNYFYTASGPTVHLQSSGFPAFSNFSLFSMNLLPDRCCFVNSRYDLHELCHNEECFFFFFFFLFNLL
jgi:hypothetical protein